MSFSQQNQNSEKLDNLPEYDNLEVVVSQPIEESSECTKLTSDQKRSLGEKHNETVIQHYSGIEAVYNPSCGLCSNEFRSYLMSTNLGVDYSALNTTKAAFIEDIIQMYELLAGIDYDIRNWQNHPFSSEAYGYLIQMTEMKNTLLYLGLALVFLTITIFLFTKWEMNSKMAVLVIGNFIIGLIGGGIIVFITRQKEKKRKEKEKEDSLK